MSSTMNDEIQTSARNIALKSVERNARQLLSDAELLFDHGRYGRATALGVLAVEEMGKYYLLKLDKSKPKNGSRYHRLKQRTVATFNLAEATLDVMERELHSMGLQIRHNSEFSATELESLKASGRLRSPESLKDIEGFMDKMVITLKKTAEHPMVQKALNGTLSGIKELGFYVDLSEAHEIITDPNDVRKEQAEDITNIPMKQMTHQAA